jgi:hypothetical protein
VKRSIVSGLFLLLAGTALAATMPRAQGSEATVRAFWQKFKAAVASGDKATVAGLSKFPLGMSYGIKSIRTKTELRRRFRQVFNQQTDAVKCFAGKEPEMDKANPRQFEVACPNEAGDEVVVYRFELTRAGWKFAALDNLNE